MLVVEFVVLWVVCGLIAMLIAQSKGNSAVTGFILGVLLGPIGIIIAAVSSRSPEAEAIRQRRIQEHLGTTPSTAPSSAAELAQLEEMHQRGTLSDDEFAAAKRRVLGLE